MTRTFFWSDLKHSPLVANWTSFVVMPVVIGIVGAGSTWGWLGLPIAFLVASCLAILIVGVNYLAWRSLGHVLTTADERNSLAVDDRAKLAWSFWGRPARKAKNRDLI